MNNNHKFNLDEIRILNVENYYYRKDYLKKRGELKIIKIQLTIQIILAIYATFAII